MSQLVVEVFVIALISSALCDGNISLLRRNASYMPTHMLD
jgi:hypothetical protein